MNKETIDSMDVEEQINDLLENEQAAFESPNLGKDVTGLDFRVWIDKEAATRSVPHSKFRIKYGYSESDCVSVPFYEKKELYEPVGALSKGKPNMRKLSRWINLNYDALVDLYTNPYYTVEDFLFAMQAVQ